MTEQQALSYIHSRARFGSKLGLERMGELMRRLGDPQKTLSFVHVAGTNGKGSTVTMLSRVLSRAGYRTGRYISPYVFDFHERISVNDTYISGELLAELTERVAAAVEEMERDGWDAVTEFEIVTAVAFLCFAAEKCDIVVLEVGLGGRFDATNIIEAPLVSVITAISKDHTAILGDTLEKIAFEKCGIIKSGGSAVSYPLQPMEAMRQIEASCREKNVPLHLPDVAGLSVLSSDLSGNSFIYNGKEYRTEAVGAYQIYNALTVLETVDALRKAGMDIPAECAEKGIASGHMDARFDRVCVSPEIVFDVGHNPQGIDELCDILDRSVQGGVIVIFAAMRDKDYSYAVSRLAKRADIFFAVAPIGNDRAAPSADIAALAAKNCGGVEDAGTVSRALEKALALRKDEMILVCGSFYIMEEAAKYLKNCGLL